MQQIVTTTVPPEAEPVTLAEAKKQLRIDHDDEDGLILGWVKAAREYAEAYTGRRFVTQTVTVKLDEWPADGVIRLDGFGPGDVTAVTSVAYLDADGDSQTVDAADYQFVPGHSPPFVALAPGVADWPDLEADRYYPVTLTLTVGADPPDVPAVVKQAILMTLAYWDEARGGEAGEGADAKGLPAGARRLLDMAWSGHY